MDEYTADDMQYRCPKCKEYLYVEGFITSHAGNTCSLCGKTSWIREWVRDTRFKKREKC